MKVFYLKSYEYSIFEYLFSYLDIEGIEVDENIEEITNTEDTYFLMSSTAAAPGLGKIIESIFEIRKIFDNLKFKIVVGGPLFNIIDSDEFMKAFPEVTHLCIGPGEEMIKSLFCDGLDNGIYYGKHFGEVRNYLINDANLEKLNESHHIRISFDGNTCRWGRCLFCHHISDKTIGASAESVFEMIDYYVKRGRTKFYFYDNYIDIKKLKTFLDLVAEEGYRNDLDFVFFGVKVSDDFSELDETLSKFESNPITKVSIGVEFYNQELLNTYRKGITIEQIDRAMNWFVANDISVGAYILLGVPGSTKEHREKYKEFILKYKDYIEDPRPSFFRLSPGIRMFNILDKFKIKLSGESYNINDLSGLNDYCRKPLEGIPEVPTCYLKFEHWDEEEQRWISRYEDLQRHKEFMVDVPVLTERPKFIYKSRYPSG